MKKKKKVYEDGHYILTFFINNHAILKFCILWRSIFLSFTLASSKVAELTIHSQYGKEMEEVIIRFLFQSVGIQILIYLNVIHEQCYKHVFQ